MCSVPRWMIAFTSRRPFSARTSWSRSNPSRRVQSERYGLVVDCACRPPSRSTAFTGLSAFRSRSSCRSSSARFSSRRVSTRSLAIGDELEQAAVGVAEVDARAATAGAEGVHRPGLDLRRPGPRDARLPPRSAPSRRSRGRCCPAGREAAPQGCRRRLQARARSAVCRPGGRRTGPLRRRGSRRRRHHGRTRWTSPSRRPRSRSGRDAWPCSRPGTIGHGESVPRLERRTADANRAAATIPDSIEA